MMFANKPSIANEPGYMIRGKTGFAMAVNDYAEEKAIFDTALLTAQYDVLTSIVWTFDGFSNFAATGGEAPSLDFDSRIIQDLLDPDTPVRHINISVFPENGKTLAITAWLRQYDSVFSSIEKKLNSISETEKRNYINNTLPMVTENIAIKPSSWESLSEPAKEEFSMIFRGLPERMEMAGKKFDRFQKPLFDLFSI